MKNFVKTTEKIISENYPYGFRLRTTKTDYIEFNKKHGFRHCYTTVNPKTGRVNAPKKSTYYTGMVLLTDENNHCKSLTFGFNGQDEIQNTINFLKVDENFNLLTDEQKIYLLEQLVFFIGVGFQAQIIYCGSDREKLKQAYEPSLIPIREALKTKSTQNIYKEISFNWELINSLKVPDFQPFKVTTYNITAQGLTPVNTNQN